MRFPTMCNSVASFEATSKGSGQTVQADLSLCQLHIPHYWKFHIVAHFILGHRIQQPILIQVCVIETSYLQF